MNGDGSEGPKRPTWMQRAAQAAGEGAPSKGPGRLARLREALGAKLTRRRLITAGIALLAFSLGILTFALVTLMSGPDSGLFRFLSGAALRREDDLGGVSPGLAVGQRAVPQPVAAGESLVYTLLLTNTGDVTLTATVVDVLPPQVEPGGVLLWAPAIPPAAGDGQGGVWSQQVAVTVPPDYLGVLTNALWVTTGEGVTGVHTGTTDVEPTPRLVLAESAAPDPVQAGSRLTYTLRLTNTGNVDLQVSLTDTLPAGVTPGGERVWQAALPVGGLWAEQVGVTVTWGYTGLLVNLVEATSDQGATAFAASSVEARVTPALGAVQGAAPAPVHGGSPLTYTLCVTNTGNVDLQATIVDVLPQQVMPTGTLVWSADLIAPGGAWTQTVPVSVEVGYAGLLTNLLQVTTEQGASVAVTGTLLSLAPGLALAQRADPAPAAAGMPLTFSLSLTNTGNVALHATILDLLPEHVTAGEKALWWEATLPPASGAAPGGVWTQTLPLTVEMDYSGPLTNVLQVTTVEGASGVHTETVLSRASRLQVAAQAWPDPVQAGSPLTYTFALTNAGNVDLQAAITSTLPLHVTPTGTLLWSPVLIPAGDAWTKEVHVSVDLDYGGLLTNVLQIGSVQGVTGVYTLTPLSLSPSFSVTQKVKPMEAVALSPLTYTLCVTNNGNVDLHAIVVDHLPQHITPTQGLRWWMATITAPDGVWTQTAVVTVDKGYSGPLTNVVEVRTFEGPTGVHTHTLGSNAPVAGLTVTSNAPTLLSYPTQFTATITQGNEVWFTWDFGDGTQKQTMAQNIDTGVEIVHLYRAVGTYTAVVTAANALGWVTATAPVTVFEHGFEIYLPLVLSD